MFVRLPKSFWRTASVAASNITTFPRSGKLRARAPRVITAGLQWYWASFGARRSAWVSSRRQTNDYHEEGHFPPRRLARFWCNGGVAAVRRNGACLVRPGKDSREADPPFGSDVCAKRDDHEQMDASPGRLGV